MNRDKARGREVGSLIGAAFGLVFVVVNSGTIATFPRTSLLVVAGAALATVVIMSVRSIRRRSTGASGPRGGASPFGRAYWTVVAIEAMALFGGSRLITAVGYPELGVAWVSVVVGTHFFALGRVFGVAGFHLLATVITVCGLAGFVLRFGSATATIPLVSGVLPGAVLLGFAVWALRPSAGAS